MIRNQVSHGLLESILFIILEKKNIIIIIIIVSIFYKIKYKVELD